MSAVSNTISESIAYYGGSFNPIHLGHVAIVEKACECGMFDRVFVVPTAQNPLKNASLLPANLRLTMTRLALEGTTAEVIEDEIFAERPCFTVDTLRRLKERFPCASFGMLMGGDAFASFERWNQPRLLASLATIYVIERKGKKEERAFFDTRFPYRELRFDIPEISSRFLRANLNHFELIKPQLPPVIIETLYHYVEGLRHS